MRQIYVAWLAVASSELYRSYRLNCGLTVAAFSGQLDPWLLTKIYLLNFVKYIGRHGLVAQVLNPRADFLIGAPFRFANEQAD